jgi:hypothetical protein
MQLKTISVFQDWQNFLLKKVIASNSKNLEDFPISDWVTMIAEGPAEYATKTKKTRKQLREEFFKSKKWEFSLMQIF